MSSPLSLLDALAQVPDPRSRKGRRHPLTAILSLAVLALLTGAKSYQAIAQFGRDKGFALAHVLGFRRGKTPTKSTFSVLFRRLDITAFEAALSAWVAARLPADTELVLNLDGKTARGSRDGDVPGQHLVAAYCQHAQTVLAQVRVDAKTNEHKAALELLGVLPVKGRIVTGDAMFCQRDLCQEVIDGEGDYLFFAKDNQPGLVADIAAGLAYEDQARRQAAAFSPPRAAGGAAGGGRGQQRGQGPRSGGEADAADHDGADQAAGLGGPATGVRADAGADREGEDDRGSGAWDHQPGPEPGRRAAPAGVDAGPLGDRERSALPA